jgi:hypothetical protein
MPIDDPLEAIERQYQDKRSPILTRLLQAARELEPFGVLNAIKALFSEDATSTRFEAFIQEFKLEIHKLEITDRLLRA